VRKRGGMDYESTVMKGRRPWIGNGVWVCVCVCTCLSTLVKAEGQVFVVEMETADRFKSYLGGTINRAA